MKKVCGIVSCGEDKRIWERAIGQSFFESFYAVWDAVEALLSDGTEEFVVVMDGGLGMLAANVLLLQKKRHENLRFTCLMLWEEQAADWSDGLRDLWFDTFAACDREEILETRPSSDNLQKRDAYLTSHCTSLLVLKGDGERQESWALVNRARLAQLEIVEKDV